MAHDEDSFTPEEQAQAEAIDQQIEEQLYALPFLPPDQRGASDPLLIQNLARFYQPQAEEIQFRLQPGRCVAAGCPGWRPGDGSDSGPFAWQRDGAPDADRDI